jgi:3-dehydroquinate dehydratase-2
MEKTARTSVTIIDGPNLNLLGQREVQVYGTQTYEQAKVVLQKKAESLGLGLRIFQSNHEGEIVDRIQALTKEGLDWLIINPGAYTHTSIAIRDAILAVGIPTIEVHISNPYAREPFRHVSTIADIVKGRIMGLGVQGYLLALEYIAQTVRTNQGDTL